MIKTILFQLFVLLSINTLVAQVTERIFSLKEQEELMKIEESDNYFVLRTYEKQLNIFNVYVFDNEGNSILTLPKLRRDLILAAPIETYNILLLVWWGDGYHENPKLKNDLLRAYDINTGQIIWETTCKSSRYEISPNSNYVITNGIFERENVIETPFTLINLSNGQQIETSLKLVDCYTNWLDTNRVVIIHNRTAYTQEYEDWLGRSKEITEQMDKINSERELLLNELNLKRISRSEFDIKTHQLNEKYLKWNEIGINLGNSRPQKIYRFLAAKYYVYNIFSDRVELEKDLYTPEGKEFYISRGNLSELHGRIFCDKEDNIYCVGYAEEISKKDTYLFIKANSNGEILWAKDMKKDLAYGIFPVFRGDEPYFRVKKDGINYLLNNKDGSIMPIDQFQNDSAFYNIISNLEQRKYQYSPRFSVAPNQKEIEFSNIQRGD